MEKFTLYCEYLLLNTKAIFQNKKQTLTATLISCMFLLGFNAQAQSVIGDYDFESGTQGWTLGSEAQVKDEPDFSCSGDNSLMVEKNKSGNIVTSPSLDLSIYASVSISFCFKGDGIKSGDGFDLKYYDGSSWATLKSYARGTDFTNIGKSNSYNFSFTILDTSYNFPANAQFRFENTTKKICYFDNIVIEGTLADFDGDSDFDGINDSVDIDDDNDGIKDTDEDLTLDSDGDTIPNLLDLDSDNDGIPDIVEAGLGSISEGTATIPLGSFSDANTNGMHDAFENTSPLDSDNDGTPNYKDLDSDNDTVFDVDEARTARYIFGTLTFENGDGDINGDGVGDGLETEAFREKDDDNDGTIEYFGDGILDIYDYGTGANEYGNLSQGTAPYYVKDTDDDGIPDYIDTTSDGSTFDISRTHYTDLDSNKDGVIDDNNDSDGDGIVDLFDTNDSAIGSPRDLEGKLDLFFDGRNDYVEDTNVMSGWSEATIMTWIKIDPTAAGNQIIIGQNSFYIQLNADKTISAIADGNTVSNVTGLNTNEWTHVAALYSNSFYSSLRLFINGERVDMINVSNDLPADSSKLTIGRKPGTDSNYFNGFIDEARIFSKALKRAKIQRMMNQEIEENGSSTRGVIIPTDITNLPWNSLKRYYRMDAYKDNVLDDLTTPAIDEGSGARIYNTKVIAHQSAPLPFVTQQSGRLEVAVNDPLKGINGDNAINNASAIVKIQHNNVYIDSNLQQVGLIIDEQDAGSNPIEFKVQNDSELNVSWYLKLDGKIDLEGESQLVQGTESYLDPTSLGKLERDQQGNKNLYSYNYWSSPVGKSNSTTNNNAYYLPDILNDGSLAASPVAINFLTSSYNGNPGTPGTTPISIADYWVWKYVNRASNNYASWQHVRSTGSLLAGEGFTMKGVQNSVEAFTQQQNYAFLGKPNNGTISLTLSAGNDYLVGNPYPSAMDANEFIKDNISVASGGKAATNIINGTLYFWDHFAVASHNLAEYEGGYATYTLIGGIAAVSTDTRINATGGIGTKIPKRYIPVSQGFFVTADTGGAIMFNNNQRIFKTEDSDPSTFLKSSSKSSKTDVSNEDPRQKIRIMFDSPKGYHRQLLVGVDENASNNFDYGYDALLIDVIKEDIFWIFNDKNYVIQGVNNFALDQKLPLGIKTIKDGMTSIKIDDLENITNDVNIYLHDIELNIYHDLKQGNYTISMPKGDYLNRFEITFSKGQTLGTEDVVNQKPIEVYYLNDKESIVIDNPMSKTIQSVEMFNILGQSLFMFNTNTTDNSIKYNAKQIKAGAYIIKITTLYGEFSKKVLVE